MTNNHRGYLTTWVGAVLVSLVLVAILFASKLTEAGIFTEQEATALSFPLQVIGLMSIGLMIHGIVEVTVGVYEAAIDWLPRRAAFRYGVYLVSAGLLGMALASDTNMLTGTEAAAYRRFAFIIAVIAVSPLLGYVSQASDVEWVRDRLPEVAA